MFTLPSYLWEPQRRGVEQTIDALLRGKDVILYSPTGGGKTEQAIQIFKWAESLGWGGCFYVNRRLLVGQTAMRFDKAGLHYGVRAADYEDKYDLTAPFQICSADTERARVYDRNIWYLHDSQIVIVDEAHIQKSVNMWNIIKDHKANGARVVLLTATPVGLADWADEIVISGRLKEYRDCNALVPAIVKSPQQPDLSKIKRNATGEYILGDKKRKIYTQSIVSDVLERWKEFNPDARPTMLYAPGKAESVWFTEKFSKLGVSWSHIDATDAVVDGKRYKLSRRLWEDILCGYKDNRIKGLSSRFKLREGIDVPNTYHCILATPIGSLASYIQTVGRVLRYSPETPDSVVVTDHGGNYHRHGSPNHDRDWAAWWKVPEHAISEMHTNGIRDGNIQEPIRCPKCSGERTGGNKCPHCGFEHKKSSRNVVMESGALVTREGRLVKPRMIKKKDDTQELWSKMFWGFKRKGVSKSFEQMYGFFAHEYHYHPPRDLDFMPKETYDWTRKVSEIDMKDLTGTRAAA